MNTISNTPQAALEKIEECRKNKNDDLYLNNLDLIEIPKEIADLTWLKRLHIINNQIQKIEGLDKLVNLGSLNLHNNQIQKIEGLRACLKIKIIKFG